jgi:hypothetical protein
MAMYPLPPAPIGNRGPRKKERERHADRSKGSKYKLLLEYKLWPVVSTEGVKGSFIIDGSK